MRQIKIPKMHNSGNLIEVHFPEHKKLESAEYDLTSDTVTVTYKGKDQPDQAFPSKDDKSTYVVMKVLRFDRSLTEQECPGLMNLNESQTRDLFLQLAIRDLTSSLPSQNGEWSTGLLIKGGGVCAMPVFYRYE